MRMSMKARREAIGSVSARYQRSGKKEKGMILSEFVLMTGYSRWQASFLLRRRDKKSVTADGAGKKKRRRRERYYGSETVAVLAKVWKIMDYICGKRLAPVLGEMTELLDRRGEIVCDGAVREKLSKMRAENLSFTRSRPLRKNDNCFVEQKNWSVVRRAVGYARYDTDEQLGLLDELYTHLRLYTNFFMPSMKLVSKQREGSRVRKRYDQALTPFQRVIASPHVGRDQKRKLKTQYESLNPAALKRSIERLQNRLYKTRNQIERSPA
ncbi:MAG TPA: hypothetical protein PLK77_05950, partial [Pyrinomonadaceae bacterium]|nr:hypothetical protein [Pyrinomonadaceae bacterium]